MCDFICFEFFLLIVKNSKSVLTVTEKQPTISSKLPIVLSLTALWRNQFNFYIEFLSVADQIKERIIRQWTCVESWSRSERSYNSHKGIYSKILEIQELLMTSQRSHVKTMWFSAFSDIFCAWHGQVLSLKIWYPLMSMNALWFCYCYKICCNWSLPQEQPIATSVATSLANLVWAFLCFLLCHQGLNSFHLKKSQIQSSKVWRKAWRMVFSW